MNRVAPSLHMHVWSFLNTCYLWRTAYWVCHSWRSICTSNAHVWKNGNVSALTKLDVEQVFLVADAFMRKNRNPPILYACHLHSRAREAKHLTDVVHDFFNKTTILILNDFPTAAPYDTIFSIVQEPSVVVVPMMLSFFNALGCTMIPAGGGPAEEGGPVADTESFRALMASKTSITKIMFGAKSIDRDGDNWGSLSVSTLHVDDGRGVCLDNLTKMAQLAFPRLVHCNWAYQLGGDSNWRPTTVHTAPSGYRSFQLPDSTPSPIDIKGVLFTAGDTP